MASCQRAAPAEPPPAGTPRLVVLVVVDQFRFDYLERAGPFFTGGVARLLDRGVSFTEAHHGHTTWTAPGHASLATGAHPARTGIVANEFRDRLRPGVEVYCVDDDRFGTSPANLLVPAFGDWLKARYPTAKVVAASGKDRGAVIPGGHGADAAFWYDRDVGRFVSSGYYLSETPGWLEDFNAAGPPEAAFLGAWEPLAEVDAAAAAAAGFAPIERGPFDTGFPRLLGGLSPVRGEGFYQDLYDTPFLDEWLGGLGRTLVESYELGTDEWPDLLALSFSALDNVGHDYGPNSPEVLDALLRLDRVLGELFAFLDQRLGEGMYVVAFSSDHGVMPLPEVVGEQARRAGVEDVLCLRRAAAGFAARYGGDPWLGAPWYLDHAALGNDAGRASAVAAAQAELEALLEACPHVEEVWTANQLATSTADARTAEPGTAAWYEALYRNSYHPERSPDVLLQWQPLFLPRTGSETTHGSPYAYDTHVPLLLMGPGLAAGEVPALVLTVDLAPTLAAQLDVPIPEEIDGLDQTAILSQAAARPN